MNARRVAELYRERAEVARRRAELDGQLSDLDVAIADALTEDTAANDSKARAKKLRKKARKYVIPERPITELDKQRAKKALREAGMVGLTE